MIRYKMVARDVNSSPTQYRTWIVNNTPDLTGQYYTGPKSGPNPFVDVSAYLITDDNVIADFNFPMADTWFDEDHIGEQLYIPAGRVLPEQICDSQLAIIDGYAYLFGSKISDKIWRAPLNNPCDWVDTGARLPTKLYGSSLAIVDGYNLYLLGGQEINDASNVIFTAPVSNPLAWTDTGQRLVDTLYGSSLTVWDGYIYLLGGQI